MSLTPIAATGVLRASHINPKIEAATSANFTAGSISARHLAQKLTGKISWSDFRNKTGVVLTNLATHIDAGYASSYSGSGSTWIDMTGNGNSGTLNAGASYSSANRGSIYFNGTTGGVSMPHNAYWATTQTSNFSLSAWVKGALGTTGTGMIFSHQRCNLPAFQLQLGATNVNFRVENVTITHNQNLLGAWHHVVGTYNGSTRAMRLYVNGSLVASGIATDNWSMTSGGSDIWLGRRTICGSTNEMIGNIACFSYHQWTLTDVEVARTYYTSYKRFS